MATLRDTMIHDTLAVIENIVLSDYKYNVVKDDSGLIYGQSDYPTTIYGSTLTLSATNFILNTTGYQQFNAGTTFDAKSGGAMTLTSGGALTETAATSIALTASSGTFAASSTGNMTLSTTSSGYILLSSKSYIRLDAVTNIRLEADTYIKLDAGTYVNIVAATYMALSAAAGYLQINNTYDSNGDGTANTAGYVRVRSQYSYVQLTSDVSYIQLTAGTYVKINSRFVVASTKCYGTSAPTTDSQGSYTGQVYFRIVS